MSRVRFLSWDFREGVSDALLARTINEFEGGPVFATAVDTGSDSYMVALSAERMSSEQAYRRWLEWVDADFEDRD
jgi:hypothetical protein